MKDFQQTVASLMVHNFSVDRTVEILVLTDKSTVSLGLKFANALENDGWQVNAHVMADRTKSGEEPPTATAEEILKYDSSIFNLGVVEWFLPGQR